MYEIYSHVHSRPAFPRRSIFVMNTLELKGNWNVIKGKLKQTYGQLTDDDLAYVDGQEEELLGRLQRRIGKTREEIQDEIKRFQSA